jgi:HEAT repeat protein
MRWGLLLAYGLLPASVVGAPQGRIGNARVETPVAPRIDREMRAAAARSGVTWVGYRVPMIEGRRHMCCSDAVSDGPGCCGGCRLESGSGVTLTNDASARGARVALEPPAEILILARFEGNALTRVRTFTPDCDVDAGGVTLVWLDDMKPDESVDWLRSLIATGGRRDSEYRNHIVKPALGALSVHAPRSALTTLVTVAKNDADTHVRGDALFWLAQRAGQDAVAAITDAIVNDPETEVKKRAVFALSQLPGDEGIPKLIDVARHNRNPEVRKQAFFWLGQSRDPRALQLFEEILLKQ